jgi:hypothetical protein
MLRGVAGTRWEPLKLLENKLQHARHENGQHYFGAGRVFIFDAMT